jgi:hypothetical protein
MTFENEDVLTNFLKEQMTNFPMQYKIDATTGQAIYRCHNDFGPLDWRELRKMLPKIADFGLATHLTTNSEGKAGKGEAGLHLYSQTTFVPQRSYLAVGGVLAQIYGILVSWYLYLCHLFHLLLHALSFIGPDEFIQRQLTHHTRGRHGT